MNSVEINATIPGTGAASVGGVITFDPKQEMQRPGLAVTNNGLVVIAWSSQQDMDPYHGWVMAYRESTTCTRPGYFAPLRMEAAAASGRPDAPLPWTWRGTCISWSAIATPPWKIPNFGVDFGEAALKFSTTGQQLQLVDWFEPDNGPALDVNDTDVGSSGLTLIPNTDLLVGGGKQGVFYLLDSSNLGHEQTGNGQIPQVLSVSPGLRTKGGPVYWQSSTLGPLIYSWNESSYLEAYHFNGATFDKDPVLTRLLIKASFGSPGRDFDVIGP